MGRPLILLLASLLAAPVCGDSHKARDGSIDAVTRDATVADTAPTDAHARDSALLDGALPLDSGIPDAEPSDSGTDAQPNRCGPARPVRRVADIVAMAPETYGRLHVAASHSTGTLVARDRILLQLSDFPVPSDCDIFCQGDIGIHHNIPGITQRDDGTIEILTGSRFRVRFWIYELPPLGSFAQALIQPECVDSCSPSYRHCELDQACYGEGEDYCRGCAGEGINTCYCRDNDLNPLPDDTYCVYTVGDLGEDGSCQGGACEPRR